MTAKIKSRAIIMHENKIFLVRDTRCNKYFLPWGTHDEGESITECFYREIKEELGITPVIDKLLCVREFFWQEWNLVIDFLFLVKNVKDFFEINKENCTHGHEWDDAWFFEIDKFSELDIYPTNLWEIIKNLTTNWQTILLND